MQIPGIDQLTEYTQLYDACKQLSSAARQFSRPRRISEIYGCTGWDMSFAGYKAMGDWQYALGVNMRCLHLSFYTMAGEAKRDYPPPSPGIRALRRCCGISKITSPGSA